LEEILAALGCYAVLIGS